MLIGLARTSTLEQVAGLERQIRDLEAFGCERVFKEQVSSVAEREQLKAALGMLRTGDKLVTTRLDRLARSVQHLGQIIERINSAGASLVILDMGGTAVDTSNPTGKLILNVMSSVAQFEREMMLERQREGIAKAKERGVYENRTRKTTINRDEVKRLSSEGLSTYKIADAMKISRMSVHRILNT